MNAAARLAVTAVLRRLSADHVLLTGVSGGTADIPAIVAFADGTRLLLGIRCGDDMGRLEQAGSPLLAWLADARPCFGRPWFWLSFTSAGRVPVEVLASVSAVRLDPPGSCSR